MEFRLCDLIRGSPIFSPLLMERSRGVIMNVLVVFFREEVSFHFNSMFNRAIDDNNKQQWLLTGDRGLSSSCDLAIIEGDRGTHGLSLVFGWMAGWLVADLRVNLL